ncbi:type II secretion system protein GspM [Chitinimonas lacunae]|uniref:Type II secretion system protein GspM n=1 Tax=Chitinimonas lacunae TaxID=1963018 RepID=A0ABV8MQQ3_9NEIS
MPSPLVQFWQQRQPRERLVLGSGAVLLAVVLLYVLLFEPVAQERQQLSTNLPSLRLDAARFKRDLQQLNGQPAANSGGLAALIANSGFAPEALRLAPAGDKRYTLNAKSVDWPALLRLLDQARRQGVKIDKLSVKTVEGGLVDAQAELSR